MKFEDVGALSQGERQALSFGGGWEPVVAGGNTSESPASWGGGQRH